MKMNNCWKILYIIALGFFCILANGCSNKNNSWYDIIPTGKENILDRYKGTLKPSVALYLDENREFIEDIDTIKNINLILTKLKSGWTGDIPQNIDIYIQDNPDFGASSDMFNQILLNTGLLKGLSSDDQLAAVLAHELSHILLKHNQNKDVYKSLPDTLEKAEDIAAAIKNYDAPSKKKHHSLVEDSLLTAWDDIGSPAWTRENESEADSQGLELLIKAGYNPNAFFSIIQKLQKAQINQGIRLQKLTEVTEKKLVKSAERDENSIKEGVLRDSLNDLTERVIEKTINALHGLLSSQNIDYDEPEAREKKLREYFIKTYPGHEFSLPTKTDVVLQEVWPAIENGLWSKLVVVKLGGKKQKKIYSYGGLQKSNFFPVKAYIRVSKWYLDRNNRQRSPDKSLEILKLGVDRIGRQYRFLPSLIYAAKAKKDDELAKKYTIECSENKSNGFINGLKDIIIYKEKPLSPLYSECVKAFGRDPLLTESNDKKIKSPVSVLLNRIN